MACLLDPRLARRSSCWDYEVELRVVADVEIVCDHGASWSEEAREEGEGEQAACDTGCEDTSRSYAKHKAIGIVEDREHE